MVRQAGGSDRQEGQTGRGVGESGYKLQESSVEIETRDNLEGTEWEEKVYIGGDQVKVVGLIRGAQGAGEWENQGRTTTTRALMSAGGERCC